MVPKEHWKDLKSLDLNDVCNNSGASLWQPDGLRFTFLNESIFVDLKKESLYRDATGEHGRIEEPLFELIALVYLLNASSVSPNQKMIGVKELRDAHFFQGPHALDFSMLLARFGSDLMAFDRVARQLQATPVDFADAAFMFTAFPKIPVYYLLWAGDEEFQPNLSVLFDSTIEEHLSADAIWGLVNLVNDKLIASDGAT